MLRALVVLALLTAAGTAGATLVPGDSTRTLVSGGIERQYLLHVPASYTGTSAVPLVVDIHGFGSNASQQRVISGMVAVADREGFVIAHPDGVRNAWNAGLCCGNSPTTPAPRCSPRSPRARAPRRGIR